MKKLEYIEVNPQTPAKASVIWLHGLGADGADFVPIVPELELPEAVGVRFIFPHAPVRRITLNQGYPMRGWYDIFALDLRTREDEEGIFASQQLIEDLIESEHQRGIPYNKIFLAGFSQGGAMALHVGLLYPQPLAGIIALSCYVPLREQFSEKKHAANHKTPIFMAHGQVDTMVPLVLGEWSRQILQQHYYHVDWHTYPMAHTVCPAEIKAVSNWLKDQIFSNKQ